MTFNLQLYIFYVLFTSFVFNLIPLKNNSISRNIFLLTISIYFIFSISSSTLICLLYYLLLVLGVYFLRSFSFIFPISRVILAGYTSYLYLIQSEITGLGDLLPLFGYSFVFLRAYWLIGYIEKSKINQFNLVDFALYIFYFPIISAGPVEKPNFFKENSFKTSFETFLEGIGRISLGTIFLIIIQKFLESPPVNFEIFFLLLPLKWLATLFFNFAGYSHIAIGTSLLFGIRLTENFNQFWLAKDFSEFWKRWHISLMNFANENFFFPCFRFFKGNQNLAIFFTLFFVGIWHGYTLAFLIWGIMQGLFFPISINFRKYIESLSLPKFISNNLLRFCVLYFQALISYAALVLIKI